MNASVDEDGCCAACGSNASGAGARLAVVAHERAERLEREAESALAGESAALEEVAQLREELAALLALGVGPLAEE